MDNFIAKKESKNVKARGPIDEEEILTVDSGKLTAKKGYFIINDKGDEYPIEPEIFYKTYENIPSNLDEFNSWFDVVKKSIEVKVRGPVENKTVIKTLEGKVTANRGDYIIEGIEGEEYVLSAEELYKNYKVPNK